MDTPKRKFSLEMHYFRAFAIFHVMFAHFLLMPEALYDTTAARCMEVIRQILFQNSTTYFIFISGFLFHYVSHKFEVKKYFKAKAKNVLVPYLLWTVVGLCLQVVILGRSFGGMDVLDAFVFGKGQIQYWYIPFISIVFLMSPLFLKLSPRNLTILCLVVAVIPMLGTRETTLIDIYQYMYFLPIYLFGMLCSQHYDLMMRLIKKYWIIIAIVAAVTSIAVGYLVWTDTIISYGRLHLKHSLLYFSRIAITFLAILLFSVLVKKRPKKVAFLDNLALLSFALYFLHSFVHVDKVRDFLCFKFAHIIPPWVTMLAFAIFSLVVSYYLSKLLKKITGKFSRLLIGA